MGHTHLFSHETATCNFLIYVGSSFIKSILISFYLAELANSSLGPCTGHRSYKHPESTTLITHSLSFQNKWKSKQHCMVPGLQKWEMKKTCRACALAPVYLWNMVSCVIDEGILVQLDFKCPKWQTPPLILKTNLENNKFHF